MTISEIRNSKKTILTPSDVCEVLGCSAYNINRQAMKDPMRLGFPVSIVGTRVKIPREGFLAFWCGEKRKEKQV